jgi:hypothetical protein
LSERFPQAGLLLTALEGSAVSPRECVPDPFMPPILETHIAGHLAGHAAMGGMPSPVLLRNRKLCVGSTAHGAFLRVTCERCGHERTFNEAHSAQRALPIRTILDRSEVWAAPISRPEPEAKRLWEPVKPLLPPEVIAVLSRNVLQDGHCSSPRHV